MLDLQDGSSAAFGVVGPGGLVGFSLFISTPVTYGTAVVQCPGSLFRVRSEIARARFEESPVFRRALIDYMQFCVAEAAQNSSCYRHHSIEQLLCRTLLSYMDFLESPNLALTHETLARSLGVRREGISLAARRLQDLECIRYSRGQIEILSPLGLQHRTCECYHVLKEMAADFFSPSSGPFQ
jgi:CRP-like cAMP-binding protein